MGIANYFSKDLLALNRLLNTQHDILEQHLNSVIIKIYFDENTIKTFEGNCGLELLIRIVSRFYPNISIIDLSNIANDRVIALKQLALKINTNIDFNSEVFEEEINIVVGYTNNSVTAGKKHFYFGSDNWVAKFSVESPQSFGDSSNPFGCSFAACIIASNIFRYIFREYLPASSCDQNIEFSVFSLETSTENYNPPLKDVLFQEVVLIGLGAIGNGAIWALSNLENAKGNINLVDEEEISLSNIQRYILTEESDIGKAKVDIASSFFADPHFASSFKSTWRKYLFKRDNFEIDCVAAAIDNQMDRIGIQSSLPKICFNAFTEPELVGISRHLNFTESACLACSYIPTGQTKNYIDLVAENCNIPFGVEMVKVYYNLNLAIDEQIPNSNSQSLLEFIANANKIEIKELEIFKGKKIQQFYSEFVCGGIILKLSKIESGIKYVDAPLSFQSVMAGILLAAELVKYVSKEKLEIEIRTDYYHLSPIKTGINPYHRPLIKDLTNRCLCRDKDFISRYTQKWKPI